MSFSIPQVRFSSSFASLFNVLKDNSLILFQLKHYILWWKKAHKRAIFWNFQVFGSKFIKFLMSILKQQVNSSSNFASFFFFMTHNSSVSFKLIHFLLWIKGSHQSPNFDTFKCSGKNLPYSSPHFPNHKSVFLQILHHSVSWKITPLYFFRSNVICFAQKEPIKVEILRISSTQVKIHQIPLTFETTTQFFFKFCFTLQCHET